MNNLDTKLGENKKLLDDYLQNLLDFIENNSQDREVYDDIKEIIYDKLSKIDTISKADIKNILKEIGSPKDIFDIEIDDKKNLSGLKFYEKFQKSGIYRDNENAIFLGLSKLVAKKLEINIFWARIIWIVLIFPFGFGVGLYLLAGIILPLKDKDYKNISIGKYLLNQIFISLGDLLKNTIKIILLLPLNFFKLIKILWNFFINNIWGIISKFVYILFALFFIGILVGFITILAFKFGHFTLANYEILALMPQTLIWGIIFGVLWSFIFMIFSINKIFSKSKVHIGLFYTGITIAFVSLFLGITGGVELFGKYNGVQNLTISNSYDLKDFDKDTLNIDIFPNSNYNSLFTNITGVKVLPSNDDKIKIENNKKIFISNNEFDKIKKYLSQIEVKFQKNNTLSINKDGLSGAIKVLPFVYTEDEITLYLPKDLKYNIFGRTYLINAHTSNKYDYLENYSWQNCSNSEIYYSESEESFVCDLDDYQFVQAKNNYIIDKLMQNFDNISSITHKVKHKRNYGSEFDWNIEETQFKANTLYFTISDMSLEIDAKVDYTFNDETKDVIFSDFEVKDVEINDYNFDKIYYEKFEGIDGKIE
ncbi:PspC domain-containing protein [Candidatus Gracilibacteria bacterium]|nr:PspC domain-containing protein [Candidatus Gracilibacteria bacterium]